MSKTRKERARLRLKAVDDVISTLDNSGVQTHNLVRQPTGVVAPS